MGAYIALGGIVAVGALETGICCVDGQDPKDSKDPQDSQGESAPLRFTPYPRG